MYTSLLILLGLGFGPHGPVDDVKIHYESMTKKIRAIDKFALDTLGQPDRIRMKEIGETLYAISLEWDVFNGYVPSTMFVYDVREANRISRGIAERYGLPLIEERSK